jgi:hypothetical protein
MSVGLDAGTAIELLLAAFMSKCDCDNRRYVLSYNESVFARGMVGGGHAYFCPAQFQGLL